MYITIMLITLNITVGWVVASMEILRRGEDTMGAVATSRRIALFLFTFVSDAGRISLIPGQAGDGF